MSQHPAVSLQIPNLSTRLQLRVHGKRDQTISRRIREDGIWEPYETSLLLSMLQPGDVFVDVGANIGYFSVLAAVVVGEGGAVFAFEPDPDNFRLLRDNVALNGFEQQVVTVEAGLAVICRDGYLFLSAYNLGVNQIYSSGESRVSLPVTRYNGSRYMCENLQRLYVLKVDTQGSEY